jgi:hypothetical protein
MEVPRCAPSAHGRLRWQPRTTGSLPPWRAIAPRTTTPDDEQASRVTPASLLQFAEAVAQTAPPTGASIGRGTTVAEPRSESASCGFTSSMSRNIAASVPPLREQRVPGRLRNSLRAKQHSSPARARVMEFPPRCLLSLAERRSSNVGRYPRVVLPGRPWPRTCRRPPSCGTMVRPWRAGGTNPGLIGAMSLVSAVRAPLTRSPAPLSFFTTGSVSYVTLASENPLSWAGGAFSLRRAAPCEQGALRGFPAASPTSLVGGVMGREGNDASRCAMPAGGLRASPQLRPSAEVPAHERRQEGDTDRRR